MNSKFLTNILFRDKSVSLESNTFLVILEMKNLFLSIYTQKVFGLSYVSKLIKWQNFNDFYP